MAPALLSDGSALFGPELGLDLNLPAEVAQRIAAAPNDFLAGWIETSAMLALTPAGWQQPPDCPVLETDMIFAGRLRRVAAGFGHIGAPRHASAELGSALDQNVAEYLAQAVSSFLCRAGDARHQRHAL